MKAVLLAAGKGERLRPITLETSKQMIKIAGKPFLEYIINDLKKSGFDEICIVTGYLGNQIKDYFKDGSNFDVKIEYVTQEEQKGTAHALQCAKSFVGNDPFLVYLSDTIIPNVDDYIKKMIDDKCEISILSSEIESETANIGNIKIKDNFVTEITEKSGQSDSKLAWAGVAFFKNNSIFEILEDQKPSHTGEYEITESLNLALQKNHKVRNHTCHRFIDCGTPKGLEETSKYIQNFIS